MFSRVRSWSQAVRSGIEAAAAGASTARANAARLDELSTAVRKLQPAEAATPTPVRPRVPAAQFSRLPVGFHCPICSADEVRWASAYPGVDDRFRMAVVLYCEQCGSGHVPDADRILEDYYRDEYARMNRRDRDSDPAEYFATGPGVKLSFRRARTQVNMLKETGATFGTVLDYGSGPGYFLHEANPERPFAVELDEHSFHYLDHLGATRLDPTALGTDRFDVIVASHVIEHFTAATLDDSLAGMRAALKVNGRILVEVPQGGHTYLAIAHNQEPHTLFFTPHGLLDAVRRAGLEVLVAKARVRKPMPPRADPVFVPPSDSAFDGVNGSGLTVIATRSG